jgi:hypothetical protein
MSRCLSGEQTGWVRGMATSQPSSRAPNASQRPSRDSEWNMEASFEPSGMTGRKRSRSNPVSLKIVMAGG